MPSVEPSPPVTPPPPPTIPGLGELVSAIARSRDKLFLISYAIPGSDVPEWSLVRIAWADSLSLHPTCLQEVRFLVKFYVCHPSNKFYNATNQQYWLQYHPRLDDPVSPSPTTHHIRPTSASGAFASAEGLRTFRRWVRINNSDTYIFGPFEFATLNGRQSSDRVPATAWKALLCCASSFANAVPSLELPDYSVHVGCFHDLFAIPSLTSCVAESAANPPPFTIYVNI